LSPQDRIMQVLVKTDNHIEGSAELSRYVESVVQDEFERYGDRVTRVEVRFGDENSDKKGGDKDKRCLIEARLGGLEPFSASDNAASLDQALSGAIEKVHKLIDRSIGRRGNQKGRPSFSGE
jgi:hypothetical protein